MPRNRPRLFAFPREVELDHVRDIAETPEEQAVLEAMIDAFGSAARTKRLQQADLDALVLGATHSSTSLRGIAVTRLAVLTHYFEPARGALLALARHDDAEIRQFAATAAANSPAELALDMVLLALGDEDWRVRKAAAQVARTVVLPVAPTALETAAAHEPDARVRVALELALRLQRATH
ncbi:MAG: HEAT repeat protein [Myxococcota bacterium]